MSYRAATTPAAGGSQTMDLAPAQGGYVEFVPAEDGMYPFETHAFNVVSRGALGMLQAGDGDPTEPDDIPALACRQVRTRSPAIRTTQI